LRTCPLIFTGGQNVSFSTSLSTAPPAFENAARYRNSEINFLCRNDRRMSLPSLVKLGPCTPQNRWAKMPHPIKLHGINVLNRQYLSGGLFDFTQILCRVQTHCSWSPIKVQGQEVKGQGHIMT